MIFLDKLYDVLDDIIDIISMYNMDYADISDIENLIRRNKYYVYGEYIFKKQPSTIEIIVIVYKDYLEYLKFDEYGFEKCKNISNKYLNYEIKSTSCRGLEVRLGENEELVRISSKTYKHISKLEYDKNIIKEFDYYLEKTLKENKKVYFEKLMEDNMDIIKGTLFDNKTLLYSLLKANLSDHYHFGRGNTLEIYRNDTDERESYEDILMEYIRKNGGECNKADIKRDLGWNDMRIENTLVNYSKSFLLIGNKNIRLSKELDIDLIEKDKIENLINSVSEEGYFGIKKIYEKMQNDIYLKKFLEKNDINNCTILGYVLKQLFQDIEGHTILMFNKGSKYSSIEEILLDKFRDTSREDMKIFLEDLGYSDTSIYLMTRKLLKGKYVQVDDDRFILEKDFSLSEETIKNASEIIFDEYKDEAYIVLNNIDRFKNKLPKLETYTWNIYLAKTILKKKNYRSIKQKNSDYRTDKIILVKENSHILTLEDLCYEVIKNEYNDLRHESKVYEFLSNKGIFTEKEYVASRKLPVELREGEKIRVDEVGKVILNK